MAMIRLQFPAENNFVGVPYTIGSASGGLKFQWTSDFPGGTSYVLQISTVINFATVTRTILTDGASQGLLPLGVYLDSALSPATKYYWRVGVNSGGSYSNFSDFSCFITTLTTPSLLTLDGTDTIAGDKVKATWAPVADAQASLVKINYGTEAGNPATYVETPKSPNTKWIDGLTTGNTYYMTAQSKGVVNFDYDADLQTSGFNIVITSDGTEVDDSTNNLVIASV
jgi:hypothetical protein